jgi:hypothetical protein
MNAFVGVFTHPFHTVTHEEGTFELKVPPGKYEIAAWQEKFGYELDTHHNLKAAREIGDSATVDVLQVISVSIENDLWFLEAYLEGIVVGLHGRKLPVWTSTLSDQRRTDQSESAGSSGTA